MKSYIIVLATYLCLFSCKFDKQSPVNDEVKVINDVFPQIIDTLAYRYYLSYFKNTLKPEYRIQNSGKLKINYEDTIIIALNPLMEGISANSESIDFQLAVMTRIPRRELIPFKKLFHNYMNTSPDFLLKNFILNNTGMYKVIEEKEPRKSPGVGCVGEIQFSRVIIDETNNIALFVGKAWDWESNAVSHLYLIKKDGAKWKLYFRVMLSIT